MSEAVELQAPVQNGRRWGVLRDVVISVGVIGLIWLGLRVLRDPEAFSEWGDLTGKLAQAMLALVLGIAGIWALFIVVNSLVEHLPARAAELVRPWIFVLPALAVVAVYLVYPAIRTIIQSFTEVPEGGGIFSNYIEAFTDPAVQIAIRNNVIWLLLAPAAAVVIGLAFAALADRVKHESLAKTFVFVPLAISMVGASVIWGYMYAWRVPGTDQVGFINGVIQFFGGEPIPFLFEIPINTYAMIVIMIWLQVGFAMVILSAAIKGVPVELTEAARIDGASELQNFFKVLVPSIRGSIITVFTTIAIVVLKVFDIVYTLTGGNLETEVVALRMYDAMFRFRNFGQATAMAVILFLAVVPIMIVNVRNLRKQGIEA
ncbi:MAG TPA: sugar ABC transporter permease [Acidimicrobiia bacterium]|nr:sugar ABC transporter permease [Acidimicrobiia bacterium]